jgi:hypothetical protein
VHGTRYRLSDLYDQDVVGWPLSKHAYGDLLSIATRVAVERLVRVAKNEGRLPFLNTYRTLWLVAGAQFRDVLNGFAAQHRCEKLKMMRARTRWIFLDPTHKT